MKTIIFTDLDGTLLHPVTYSFEAARPALELIRKNNIPLVLCSSKTRAELLLYQKRLSIRAPFVSENGGGVFAPAGYFSSVLAGEVRGDLIMVVLGLPYNQVRKGIPGNQDRAGCRDARLRGHDGGRSRGIDRVCPLTRPFWRGSAILVNLLFSNTMPTTACSRSSGDGDFTGRAADCIA